MPGTNPESLKSMLQATFRTNDTIVEARVISASPLKVQATNDAKLILSEASLIVPRNLTDYTTTATFALDKGNIDSETEGDGRHCHGSSGAHEHSGGTHGGHDAGNGSHGHDGGAHTHSNEGPHDHRLVSFTLTRGTITVYNALKVDEIIYMLPVNNGKKYFILDREG